MPKTLLSRKLQLPAAAATYLIINGEHSSLEGLFWGNFGYIILHVHIAYASQSTNLGPANCAKYGTKKKKKCVKAVSQSQTSHGME